MAANPAPENTPMLLALADHIAASVSDSDATLTGLPGGVTEENHVTTLNSAGESRSSDTIGIVVE
jgi:hypothetical protein